MPASCLAHVINLATQALLGTYSKSKHFDPEDESLHDVDVTGYIRDEVGLIRAITVKVRVSSLTDKTYCLHSKFLKARSSSKRKERLFAIQIEKGADPRVLLLDMKVRWSSTYVMLLQAVELKAVRFILRLHT